MCGHYRGDGVNRVHDCEKQNIINTARVVGIAGPGYLLTGRVIHKRRVSSDIDLVVVGVSHSIARTTHVLIFNQGLALFGHQHYVTVEIENNRPSKVIFKTLTTRWFPAEACELPNGSKLLQGFHKVCFQNTIHQPSYMHHKGWKGLVGVIVAFLQNRIFQL